MACLAHLSEDNLHQQYIATPAVKNASGTLYKLGGVALDHAQFGRLQELRANFSHQ